MMSSLITRVGTEQSYDYTFTIKKATELFWGAFIDSFTSLYPTFVLHI